MDKYAIILAAGVGSRMNSDNPRLAKVAMPILGKPMIDYVFETLTPLNIKEKYVVVGHAGESVEECVKGKANIVWQNEILGTGHAVKQCESMLKDKEGLTLILCGDTPLLTTATLEALIDKHEKEHNDLTLISCLLQDPTGYGRVMREKPSLKIKEVVNRRDWTSDYDFSYEVNSGIYILDNKLLFDAVNKIKMHPTAHHYFLTEIVKILHDENKKIGALVIEEANEVFSIYDRVQLAYAEKTLRKRINRKLMLSGVTIEDPDTAYISAEAVIAPDTFIGHNSTIIGKSIVGKNCFIGPNVYLDNVEVGNGVHIVGSYIFNSKIEDNKSIGPFQIINDDK